MAGTWGLTPAPRIQCMFACISCPARLPWLQPAPSTPPTPLASATAWPASSLWSAAGAAVLMFAQASPASAHWWAEGAVKRVHGCCCQAAAAAAASLLLLSGWSRCWFRALMLFLQRGDDCSQQPPLHACVQVACPNGQRFDGLSQRCTSGKLQCGPTGECRCTPACLHACMPACLHACMPARLHACMHAWTPVCAQCPAAAAKLLPLPLPACLPAGAFMGGYLGAWPEGQPPPPLDSTPGRGFYHILSFAVEVRCRAASQVAHMQCKLARAGGCKGWPICATFSPC